MRRRVVATLCVMVLGLGLFPARADAFFWDWLDDLSGPHFKGFEVDIRVVCRSEDALAVLALSLLEAKQKYERRAAGTTGPSKGYFTAAASDAELGLQFSFHALQQRRNGEPASDVNRDSQIAVSWGNRAAAQFKWGVRVETIGQFNAADQPPADQPPAGQPSFTLPFPAVTEIDSRKIEGLKEVGTRVVGVAYSICPAAPLMRNRSFVSLNIGWGYDDKPENMADHNRMVTVGGSYHQVITPYLVVGAGAGIARFSSTTAVSFGKLFIQPYIIDVRPFAVVRNAELRGPWWHALYVRYNGLIFPDGFEPGRFGNRSPRYGAELVHSVGIFGDLEPLVRSLRHKW